MRRLVNDPHHATVAGSTFKFNLQRFRALGGQFDQALFERLLGVSFDDLDDENIRVPIAIMYLGAAWAAQTLNNPVLGLHHAGGQLDNLPGYVQRIAEVSVDALDFIQIYARYMCVLTELGEFVCESQGASVGVHFQAADPALITAHQVDAVLLFLVEAVAKYFQIWPSAVRVRHACPEGYAAEYARAFRTQVQFQAPVDQIDYSAQHIKPRPDCAPVAVFTALVKSERARHRLLADPLSAQVLFLLERLYIRQEANRARVAALLNLSVRTLLRRLQAEGVTFKTLMDEHRKALALRYLKQPHLTLANVALLVGYSEPSQFYKAFQRWFGQSVSVYRRSLR